MLISVLTYKHSKAVLKPLLLVIFCWCGFAVKAQIKTAATFSTFSSEPVVFGIEVKGGHHQVTSKAVRDAIPEAKRQWGMLCTVYKDGDDEDLTITYQLVKGKTNDDITDNDNWELFESGTNSGDTKLISSTDIEVSGTGVTLDPYQMTLKTQGTVYYGSLDDQTYSEPVITGDLTTDNTKKNGVYNITFDTNTNGKYFVFVAPAAWRNPKLMIEGDDTLNVLVPMQNITLNSNDYTVWSTNVTIPTGKELVIK